MFPITINRISNNYIILLLIGAALAFASLLAFPPFNFWYIGFIAYPLLYCLTNYLSNSLKKLIIFYLFYGLMSSLLYYYWLVYAVNFALNSIALAVILYIIFVLASTAFYVAVAMLYRLSGHRVRNSLKPLLFTLIFVIVFEVKSYFLSWYSIPVMFVDLLPILQILHIIPSIFVSLILLIMMMSPVYFIYYKGLIKGIGLITLLPAMICYIYGAKVMQENNYKGYIKVALIQPNIPQGYKGDPLSNLKVMQMLENAITEEKAALYILPETSFSTFINKNKAIQRDIQRLLPIDSFIIFGGLRYTDHLYNSAFFMNKDGLLKVYDKMDLVPFGEYIPFFSESLVGHYGLTPGISQSIFHIKNFAIAPLICYEVATSANNEAINRSSAIVNIANDAWYKNSLALDQHLAITQIKAIKARKPILRAANTGISAYIDKYGRSIIKSKKSIKSILFFDFMY